MTMSGRKVEEPSTITLRGNAKSNPSPLEGEGQDGGKAEVGMSGGWPGGARLLRGVHSGPRCRHIACAVPTRPAYGLQTARHLPELKTPAVST